MSSTYVPPALRARQQPSSSSSSTSNRHPVSSSRGDSYRPSRQDDHHFDKDSYRSGPSSSTYQSYRPSGETNGYSSRMNNSYSAPGRSRGDGESGPRYAPGAGAEDRNREVGYRAERLTNASASTTSIAGPKGAYRTPAQRAQDRSGSEQPSFFSRQPFSSSSSSSLTYSNLNRERERSDWPVYDQPNTRSNGYSHASSDGYNSYNGLNGHTNGTGQGYEHVPRSASGPGRSRNAAGAIPSASTSPTLYVFGDSFVGPMKLLSNESARCQTFKGASAKGLNNPHSAKQVAKQLMPVLNNLIAPEYGYIPRTGRWALLIFGNVDLQINYLWQLQHKPLTTASFPPGTALPSHILPPSHTSSTSPSAVDENATNTILAKATETSLSGHALGPELFVQAIAKAYTAFLEREIVNGPIGIKLQSAAKGGAISNARTTSNGRVAGKVLIAAALPPLVEDDVLPRIPEKYVERLEDEHEKTQRALRMEEEMSRARADLHHDATSSVGDARVARVAEVLEGLTIGQRLTPSSPPSNRSIGSDGTSLTYTTDTLSDQTPPSARSGGQASTAPSSPPSLATTASIQDPAANVSNQRNGAKKTPIVELLSHDPPLCTLPVRVRMTNAYNELVKTYVLSRSDVFEWIDIGPVMRAMDAENPASTEQESKNADHTNTDTSSASDGPEALSDTLSITVNRQTWACPVDPTNVHPLWEPTLPLWLGEMKKVGLETDSWRMDERAEETFKAYEEDKRRRTERREMEWKEAGRRG